MSEIRKGKLHSEETRKKMSEIKKGKSHSEETKIKMSKLRKGEKNTMYGKTHSEEARKRMREANKNKKWWNDGSENEKFCVECPGENWVRGRIKKKTKS